MMIDDAAVRPIDDPLRGRRGLTKGILRNAAALAKATRTLRCRLEPDATRIVQP